MLGTLVAALAAVGRALWLRGAARRFARVRGPRFAAAVEAPRAALPAGPAAPASDPGAPASASPEPGAPGGEGPA